MRVRGKLAVLIGATFMIIGATGVFSINYLRTSAESAAQAEAKNVATTMANMFAYQIIRLKSGSGQGPAHDQAALQDFVNFVGNKGKYDIEIFDRNLITLADVDQGDVGKPIEAERSEPVAMTFKDGVARTFVQGDAAHPQGLRQVAVPMRDAQNQVSTVLVYDYTPLYFEILRLTQNSWRVVSVLSVLGLLAALGSIIAILRSMSALSLSNRALQDEIEVRRKTEDTLVLRNQAVESSVNAIMISALDGTDYPIEYVNPAFERMSGYSAAEACGRASDYLVGNDRDQAGFQEIKLALRERREGHAVLRCYRKDGSMFWIELHIAPVRRDDGTALHYVSILTDVTEARNLAEQLQRQANFDMLTGLANRSLLQDRLSQAIVNSSRREDALVVAFIDLDDFKLVNDSLGHDVGDELLRTIAERLKSCVRQSDTVARLGGDEFVLLLPNQATQDNGSLETNVTTLMQKLLATIFQPMTLAQREVRVTGSIGVGIYPQDGQDAETLLKNADTAMYRAKELGRNGFQFFTADLNERVRRQIELGASLRLALERKEFELYYQPQVSLHSGRIVGMEALLRWHHPELGLIGPAQFVGFSEESGLIIPIGEWVLQRACAQNKAWQDAGLPAVPVAVNISAKQCAQPDLEAVVRNALVSSGLPARFLELELTESLSMADPEKSVPLMERLKEIGIELSIDDFGTGYSNMSYLRRFPVDRLKLDISFVREITTDPSSLSISEAIITLSHSLHLEVVAEGVETEGQLALLRARGCDLIQGYYFSKPLPAPAMARLLQEDRRLPSHVTGRTPDAPALLMLDDDPIITTLLKIMLEPEGYVLLSANRPSEAFELLARNEVAVILCDQRMPEMDGVEFLSRVRHMYPDTVRILLSAYEDFDVTRQAINRGAVYKFIEKPLQAEALRAVVEEAFRQYEYPRESKRA